MRYRIVLAAALFALSAACGSSSPSAPSPAPTAPSPSPSPGPSGPSVSIVQGSISLTTTAYAPNPVTVSPGGTVTWTNNDSIAHTSTGDGGAWNSGSIAPGAKYSRAFPTAGTFSYHCAFHPGMVGTVTVQ